jgi:hypothetical protein
MFMNRSKRTPAQSCFAVSDEYCRVVENIKCFVGKLEK